MSPVVGVILGSKSDLPLMEACVKVLDELGIEHEVKVCSAHRNPRGVMEWASSARQRGLKVVIAAAGGAAHLPGVVAAWTDLREQSVAEAKRALVDRWEKSSLPVRLKALEYGLQLQYRRMRLLGAQLGTAQS